MVHYHLRWVLCTSLLATCAWSCGSSEDSPSTSVAGSGAGGVNPGSGGTTGQGGSAQGGGSQGGTGNTGGTGEPVNGECGSVRFTQYTADASEWCGFDRTNTFLPDFVRAGMTVAIAEPWNGSSYKGDPGEACGECWEVDTLAATQIVMVHDLCPIEGNPVCAGSHFHFDLSSEAAAVLRGDGNLGEGSLRRVPCPVSGNIQMRVGDRNEYGYLKVSFFNHRFPIRTAEYRPVGGSNWLPMTRCLARWCVEDDNDTFASDGPGAVFRLTSAAGEVVEGTQPLTAAMPDETILDTGAQFAPAQAQGGACVFGPPGDVYDEGWGGIDGVRWEYSSWGDPAVSEVTSSCAEASASCLLLGTFESGDGIHMTYRSPFPIATFAKLSLQVRAQSGGGELDVAPRNEGGRCSNSTKVQVTNEWTKVDIDLAASCPGETELIGLTISHPASTMDLMLDEIRFE